MTDPGPAGRDAIAVIKTNPRVPFPRGFSIVVLGIVCAVIAAVVVILVLANERANKERNQLSCQVEKLGGNQVGQQSCPPSPAPSKTADPRLTPPLAVQPSPTTTTYIVMVPSPTPHVVYRTRTRTVYVTPSARATSSPRASSASASPKPSPTRSCIIPNPILCPFDKQR